MRIAWFSPLPPTPSGIADYSAELLPLIAERADVDAYCPRDRRRRVSNIGGAPILDPQEFQSRASGYDAVFHHVGNNPFHEFVYRASLEWPGVAVLHEFVLHHLVEHLLMAEGRYELSAYRRLVDHEYGGRAGRLADLRAVGAFTGFDLFMFPLSGHVVRASKAVVVHSEAARDQVLQDTPQADVSVIPHHAGRPPQAVAGVSSEEARARLGLPAGAFLVGQFGFITKPKQPAAVLGGFSRLLERRPDALLLVIGDNQLGVGVEEAIARRGLSEHVRLLGYVDPVRFHLALKAVDAVVNLRYPSAGEASGTFTRALAEGKPAIVSDLGSFAEVPGDVCLKVEVDGDQAEAVGAHLLRLAEDPALGAALGARARLYASTALDPRRCADRYLEVAANTAGGRVVSPA